MKPHILVTLTSCAASPSLTVKLRPASSLSSKSLPLAWRERTRTVQHSRHYKDIHKLKKTCSFDYRLLYHGYYQCKACSNTVTIVSVPTLNPIKISVLLLYSWFKMQTYDCTLSMRRLRSTNDWKAINSTLIQLTLDVEFSLQNCEYNHWAESKYNKVIWHICFYI